jgi:hypothetical protein
MVPDRRAGLERKTMLIDTEDNEAFAVIFREAARHLQALKDQRYDRQDHEGDLSDLDEEIEELAEALDAFID